MITILMDSSFKIYEDDLFLNGDGMTNPIDYGWSKEDNRFYYLHQDYQGIATIMGMYNHPESGCAWMVVQNSGGGLFSVDIEYDEIPF